MQATLRVASVISSTLPARHRMIRDVRPTTPYSMTSQKVPPILTADEASAIIMASLGDPSSEGIGGLGMPAAFKSREMLYRIRLTILHHMGSASPGASLDEKRRQFLSDFQPHVTLPTFTMIKAQWKYLSDMRDATYQALRSSLSYSSPKRELRTAALMRAFVRPLQQRNEIVEWHLFHAYVAGYIDGVTSEWLKRVWDHFEISYPDTFFRRLRTGFTFKGAQLNIVK